MPVRLLSSSVMKWPDAQTVHRAMEQWAKETAEASPEVVAIGYFGSYARGDWGVGSDVDIVIVVRSSQEPPLRRPLQFNTLSLPVPADVMVYTLDEWQKIDPSSRFGKVLQNEVKMGFSAH